MEGVHGEFLKSWQIASKSNNIGEDRDRACRSEDTKSVYQHGIDVYNMSET